jgi:glycosyltransferase involved in cell wall biosynthesis
MERPSLSIVTPALNGRRFIADCIESVIRQGTQRLEHIVVDGGSVDGTREIVREYARQHPHIKLIAEQDRGQSDAVNKGIRAATGQILGILNVDDYYEEGAIKAGLAQFPGLRVPALVVGNCRGIDQTGATVFINRPGRVTEAKMLIRDPRNPYVPVNPSAYFYHRALHDVIGGYDVSDHFMADFDFLIRAARVAHIRYVDRLFGHYRLVPGSVTHDAGGSPEQDQRFWRILDRHYSTTSVAQRAEIHVRTQILRLRYAAGHMRRRLAGRAGSASHRGKVRDA